MKFKLSKPPLFPITVIFVLFCISLIEMYSLTYEHFPQKLFRHIAHIIASSCILIVSSSIPINFFKRYAYKIYCISLSLICAVSLFGQTVMGAKRWLKVGLITLQPSEIMRVALILALAKYLSNITLPDLKHTRYLIGSVILLLVPTVFIINQPDLGTAMLLIFVYVSIIFVAGVQIWKLVAPLLILSITAPLIWTSLHEYQKNRILMFVNPETDPNGAGYHIIQSKIALGAGGVFGLGVFNGTQCQLDFLPEKHNDFIFSAIGEEFGFIGCVTVLALYVLLLVYNYKVAIQTKDKFSKYTVFGINAMLFFYILINIAMVCGLAPIVGVPLPFLSYGGTALVILMFCEGLIFSIKNYLNK